jgi:hypothetical protein
MTDAERLAVRLLLEHYYPLGPSGTAFPLFGTKGGRLTACCLAIMKQAW